MEVFSEDKDIVALRNQIDRLEKNLGIYAEGIGKRLDRHAAIMEELRELLPFAREAAKLLDNPATRFLKGRRHGA